MQPADSTLSSKPPTDRESLAAWRRDPGSTALRPIIERYAAFVFSSALRRTGSAEDALAVTRAVFLVLARRARKLRRKEVLATWLFHITAIACPKLRRRCWWPRLRRARRPPWPADATTWTRIAPEMDRALDRLATRQRRAVLLCAFLNDSPEVAARILGTRERRLKKRLARALNKLARRLGKRDATLNAATLAHLCMAEGSSAALPASQIEEILAAIEEKKGRGPSGRLARRTLRTLMWARWRRRVAVGLPVCTVLLVILATIAWRIDARTGHSRLLSAFLVWSVRWEGMRNPGLAEPARPWPTNAATPRLKAADVRDPGDLYNITNIWLAHLKFTREQWRALEPKYIGALPNFLREDGTVLLRNPNAKRSGLAGVLGYDFDWSRAHLEFGGLGFTDVAVRIKGNGSWLGSLYGPKRAFKVDLNKFTRGQKLAGLDELTFNNLVGDYSSLSDALAYEFFREAGVPAPRTAYAWLSASVAGKWDHKPLGFYLMVEPVDESFAADRFGSKKAPVFKPVTYQLFEHLGDDWSAYEAIYDLKTKATMPQRRRLIELARLVSLGSDAEFAARVGDYLDLDEFARFLAGQVLLSSYDSILADGQNFYVYLDTRSNRFGFIPWDLDVAWGRFEMFGSRAELERASIWQPWVGENRFLERVLKVEAFRRIYRAHLEDFLARLFVPDRLLRRVDEMAVVVREPTAAESAFRLNKFEQEVGTKPVAHSPGETPHGVNHPAHPFKRFVEARARSVRLQLDGKSAGMILKRRAQK